MLSSGQLWLWQVLVATRAGLAIKIAERPLEPACLPFSLERRPTGVRATICQTLTVCVSCKCQACVGWLAQKEICSELVSRFPSPGEARCVEEAAPLPGGLVDLDSEGSVIAGLLGGPKPLPWGFPAAQRHLAWLLCVGSAGSTITSQPYRLIVQDARWL